MEVTCMNDILLEAEYLTKCYGKKQALSNINITLEKGKIIGLLGPNGSGKSTFIKLCNGLLQPTSGSIKIMGQPIGIETKKVVSYLPERTYLDDNMTPTQLLDYFMDFYEDFDKERALGMFRSLNIDMKQRLKNMSKGTKEKVQLILVMSRRAKLYILDEPIGGVDPAARDYILNTIITNYDPEASVIISTHLISDIENVLDEVIFIKNGEKVLQKSVDAIREDEGKSIDALFREVFRC